MVDSEVSKKQWIRGVNIGGWLVIENFITPYLFALTECHINGDFRFYENQIDAPPKSSPIYKPMDDAARKECPALSKYPVDEWSFTESFKDPEAAKALLDIHYDNFVTRENISKLKENGVTHVRVPVSHWITGNIAEDEPYVEGGWKYFKRLVEWCREEGIEIWPDLHTAPGSQNGFDNSGHIGKSNTCNNWDNHGIVGFNGDLPRNVGRTLNILEEITARIRDDGLTDVVTGFGLLNEPFGDCSHEILEKYNNRGFEIVRRNMGMNTSVYISDSFMPNRWNGFWTGPEYKGTFLDSHMYHSFQPHMRHLSPRQQIALVCQADHHAATSCCYENRKAPEGIGRIFSEWSASFDQDVGVQVPIVMEGIRYTGNAPAFNRKIEPDRQAFLRNYVEAQMVNFETSQSQGWFYWNFKMEGGYSAEWDFLRGLEEGWIPRIPGPDINSEDVYGSCYDIMFKTNDTMTIVHEFPPPPKNYNNVGAFDDDIVISHGANLRKNDNGEWYNAKTTPNEVWFYYVAVFLFTSVTCLLYSSLRSRKQSESGYSKIEEVDSDSVDTIGLLGENSSSGTLFELSGEK